jgi:Starch binding domain
MKKLITLAVFAMLMSMAGSSFAVIDWAGAVWPNAGSDLVPTGDVDVYVQVFKAGVTDQPGQGADIMIDMLLANSEGASFPVPMTYLGDNGANNDEYTAQIPQSMLAGASWIDAEIIVSDLSDGTTYTNVTDQAGNVSPLRYNVVDALPNDVDVTFSLCMSGQEFMGLPCVIGDAAEIGAWGTGVNMTQVDGDLFEVTVTFLAGTNPNFQYKFKMNDCVDWESVDNRPVTLPTDNSGPVVLETQSWNNTPMGCGMETFLTEDKEVCFQVCMDGVDFTENVCLIGNLPEFGEWGTGVPMIHLGGSLYQACVLFSAGTPIPVNGEYKFKKDGCETWENVGNRPVVIDNNLDVQTTLTHSWDDGPGVCGVVDTQETNWDSLKAQYR